MSDHSAWLESQLKDFKHFEIRDLYKKSFPGSPTGGAGITKDYLIEKLLNRSQELYSGDISVKFETKEDVEDIKAHYREILERDAYNKVDKALV